MRIQLDRAKCTGIGMCEAVDPDRFEIGEDGDLIVHSDQVSSAALADAERAVQACPTAALRLTDE